MMSSVPGGGRPPSKSTANATKLTVGQDARIHVSEPDFEALTQGGLLVDSSSDGGITIVEFERIMRSQLNLHVQACVFAPPP